MKLNLTRTEVALMKQALIISLAHCELTGAVNQAMHDILSKLAVQCAPYKIGDADFDLDGRLVRKERHGTQS